MSEVTSRIQDVCLFWDVQNNDPAENNIVKISLCPLRASNGAGVPSAAMSLETVEKEDEVMSDEVNDEGGDTPGSVLQFERALRKAQHAKKAGKGLCANDLKIVYKDDHIIVVVRKG